jgi:hypothetical protein
VCRGLRPCRSNYAIHRTSPHRYHNRRIFIQLWILICLRIPRNCWIYLDRGGVNSWMRCFRCRPMSPPSAVSCFDLTFLFFFFSLSKKTNFVFYFAFKIWKIKKKILIFNYLFYFIYLLYFKNPKFIHNIQFIFNL